jgi:hypothetical protein
MKRSRGCEEDDSTTTDFFCTSLFSSHSIRAIKTILKNSSPRVIILTSRLNQPRICDLQGGEKRWPGRLGDQFSGLIEHLSLHSLPHFIIPHSPSYSLIKLLVRAFSDFELCSACAFQISPKEARRYRLLSGLHGARFDLVRIPRQSSNLIPDSSFTMIFSQTPSLVSLLAIILSSTHTTTASPLPQELQGSPVLEERACANPCGWAGQLCCGSDQYCYTDANNQAQCGNGAQQGAPTAAGPGWQMYTTTYVQTDFLTVTKTYSSYIGGGGVQYTTVTQNGGAVQSGPVCKSQLGESSCGSICCAQGQFCASAGQCLSNAATTPGGGGIIISTVFVTASATNSPFIRPTTQTVQTVVATGTATTTIPFQTPVATDGSQITGAMVTQSGGLSGGAIAGIVIGVLAALTILFWICVCCCAKGAIDGILSLFGLGGKKNRRTEETYIEEHHHHSSSGAPPRRNWFGQRPSRPDQPEKKSDGLRGLLSVAGILGGLALVLGLKRRHDKKEEEKSRVSGSSYYSYSDYTSASEYS